MRIEIDQNLDLFLAQCIGENQSAWNKKTRYDIASSYYGVDKFKKGGLTLFSPELDLLGDVRGSRILHLQCYFGLDSLSLNRLGAQVTGIDFCSTAIDYAKQLSSELGLETDFFYSDVYDLDKLLLGKFDKVFSSYGAICWLPNLDVWAVNIFEKLEQGGSMYLVDFHPWVISFDLLRDTSVKYPYFNDMLHPFRIDRRGTYADASAPVEGIEFNWNHSIHEILKAFKRAGFSIEEFNEFPYLPKNDFPGLQLGDDGFYHSGQGNDSFPLMFSLKATRE